MSEISEAEIKTMSKEQNYLRGYSDGKSDTLDKIRAEIEKWHKEGTNWSDIRLMKIEDILNNDNTESEE